MDNYNIVGGNIPSNMNDFMVSSSNANGNILACNTNVDIINDSIYGQNIRFGMDKKEVKNKLKIIIAFAINRTVNKNVDLLIQIKSLKVTDEKNNTFIKNTMNEFAALVGSTINKSLDELTIDMDKDILLNIFHLTGITNKSLSELSNIQSELSKKLNLQTNFRTKSILNLYQSFVNKLTPNFLNKCKNNDFYECLVQDGYIERLTDGLYNVLELNLVELLHATKYENIKKVYGYKDSILNMLKTAKIETPKKIEGFIANAIFNVLLEKGHIEHFSVFGSLFD
jgi:hypothetical protein